MNSRWYSNVFTPNARLLNLAPPSTKLSRHALILRWIRSMPCLHLSVTKVYASVEAQVTAMYQVNFLHQPSTPWLVALSVRRHTSVLVQLAVSATFLLWRMNFQSLSKELCLCTQGVTMWIIPDRLPSIAQQANLAYLGTSNSITATWTNPNQGHLQWIRNVAMNIELLSPT